MWKSRHRFGQSALLLAAFAFLTWNAWIGRGVVFSAPGPIDCYYNVEHYPYSARRGKNILWLRECDYTFCDHIVIPGMPGTKEEDFLNQWIFSEAQVPQGLCMAEDYVLITSYSSEEKCKGELMVIDRESGAYLATLGMDANSHLGGIAYDGTNVWVCNSTNRTVERISYDFIDLMAKENRRGVIDATEMVDAYPVKNAPSCITYYAGRLWIATHNSLFSSRMVAYHLDTGRDRLDALSEYRIPARVQGIAFGEDGSVCLSTSYGRRESSWLRIYSSLIELSTRPKEPRLEVEMPPGSEEIDILDGALYVIFESAGEKYYEGTDGRGTSIAPIDKILEIRLP